MKKPLSFLFLLFSLTASAQDVRKDLLICHAEPGVPQFTQKIVAYHFVNGMYTGKEDLMQFDGKKDGRDYIRLDQGRNQFYRQRYIITGIGNIIDLKNKTVAFDGRANLVKISNDSAIYYTNDAFKGKFYSVFDFKTGRYSEVKDLLFNPRAGQDIEFDKKQKPFHVYYYPKNKPGVLLTKEGGFGQQNLPGQKYLPDPPIHWLSDSSFLFPAFSSDGLGVQLVQVNLLSLSSKIIGSTSLTALVEPAKFEKLGKDIVLHAGGSQIIIDVMRNALVFPATSVDEKGFNYAATFDPKGRSIYQNGKEIGKMIFDLKNFKVTDNMAAVLKMMVVGNETYQQGLQIWNGANRSWQRVETDEIAAIIGWLDVPEK